MTEESLPTEYNIAGRDDSDTTSRRICMLSASRTSRWDIAADIGSWSLGDAECSLFLKYYKCVS